ncbi:hypothetical protein D9M73_245570 [compost metagenome]
MPVGIFQGARTVTVKLILDLRYNGCAGIDRLFVGLVDIRHVQMQTHGRRIVRVAQRSLIARCAQHDRAIADAQFGVADTAIGHVQAHDFNGAKGFFVESDGFGGFVDAQIGGDAVIPLWNGFDAHDGSPCSCFVNRKYLCRCTTE